MGNQLNDVEMALKHYHARLNELLSEIDYFYVGGRSFYLGSIPERSLYLLNLVEDPRFISIRPELEQENSRILRRKIEISELSSRILYLRGKHNSILYVMSREKSVISHRRLKSKS